MPGLAVGTVLNFVEKTLALSLYDALLTKYQAYQNDIPSAHFDGVEAGRRSMMNLCLYYLMQSRREEVNQLALNQFNRFLASNKTNSYSAMKTLIDDAKMKPIVLDRYYQQWKNDHNALLTWYEMVASSKLPDTLECIKAVVNPDATNDSLNAPHFDITNPNQVRALMFAFIVNYDLLHKADGKVTNF